MGLLLFPLMSFFLLSWWSPSSAMAVDSNPGSKFMMNQIDQCWRWDLNWANDRQALADCARGFGAEAAGGKGGAIYVVNNTSDDPATPAPGTLRFGVIQSEPLWIVFDGDMSFTLKNELIVNSYKTIDGRGAKVEISGGPCVTIQDVTNVIIHGISIHDCKPGKAGLVRSSPDHLGHRLGSDGDAISIFTASKVWIDHCSLSSCADGLIDIIHGSTDITVSNCYFTNHDKVMLFGHDDEFVADKDMRVTVAYNYFGPGCVERMPRVRHGYAHVANNRYDEWKMYAIGGSANPTIFSQGNYFYASDNPDLKQVTKRETDGWTSWKWRSSQDNFVNGAFFVPSGFGSIAPPYSPSQMIVTVDGTMVPLITGSAGVLSCAEGTPCLG